METHAHQEIKNLGLGFQVQILKKIVDRTIESSFDQILTSKPSTFKTEVDWILSELKNPEVPKDWYSIYRQKILSRVLKYFTRFSSSWSFSYYESYEKNFLVIFNTCIELFDDEPTEQLELLEFLFDFLAMSSNYLGKYKEVQALILKSSNDILSRFKELWTEVFKKYSEKTNWNSTDSISGILIKRYFNGIEEGYADSSLSNQFLKVVLEKSNIFTKSGATDSEIIKLLNTTLELLR